MCPVKKDRLVKFIPQKAKEGQNKRFYVIEISILATGYKRAKGTPGWILVGKSPTDPFDPSQWMKEIHEDLPPR